MNSTFICFSIGSQVGREERFLSGGVREWPKTYEGSQLLCPDSGGDGHHGMRMGRFCSVDCS